MAKCELEECELEECESVECELVECELVECESVECESVECELVECAIYQRPLPNCKRPLHSTPKAFNAPAHLPEAPADTFINKPHTKVSHSVNQKVSHHLNE